MVFQEKVTMRIEPLFLIHNQEVPVHPVSHTLEEDLIEAIGRGAGEEFQAIAQQQIDPLTCPVHQQHAHITVSVSAYTESIESFEGDYQIDICCPEFKATITEALYLQ
jgi:hypothetical protein